MWPRYLVHRALGTFHEKGTPDKNKHSLKIHYVSFWGEGKMTLRHH